MSHPKITHIIFDDNVVLKHLSDQDLARLDSEETVQKAADLMLASLGDVGNSTDEEQTKQVLAAADLPENLFDMKVPYIRSDILCRYIKTHLKGKYRIGLLVGDKPSARQALGVEYDSIFDDIIAPDKIDDYVRYFFEDSVYVSIDTSGANAFSGACRFHLYESTDGLSQFLASPPPLISGVTEDAPIKNYIAKPSSSLLRSLVNMPKRTQYLIDFVIIWLIIIGIVVVFFPDVSKNFYEDVKGLL